MKSLSSVLPWRSWRLGGSIVLLLLGTTAAHPPGVPDPDPQLELKSLHIAPGWKINLFASDPMLAKPIQMNFDAAGRLWVATSSTYPQIKPGQVADDKIIVLEDTRHAGVADKATVFADHLLIPTGVIPGDGGAYVANSTELLYLKDTDGDGHADVRKVLLSGFGTEDTHHIIHTFRWGPDGELYFNQSIYIHSHLETPWGPRTLLGGGIWRFRPETMRIEVFARGWINPWGHLFDRWGQSFVTDGAGGEGINHVVPDAYYATAVDAPRIFPGLNPGQPKFCSEEMLAGRNVPPDWQGSILTNDFRGHRVARFVLSDDGSGFASRRVEDFITTTHVAFRPVDIKMGPDGAIYIADFYNPIINHGEVDFRDPRRDTTHGRIWRIVRTDRPLVTPPKLIGAPVRDLLGDLKLPERWTREQARRVLKDRGPKEVIPALADWVKQLDPQDPEFEHHRLEALWVTQSLDVINEGLLRAVLGSKDFRARAAAVRVIYFWHDRLPDAMKLLEAAVADASPRVRLEAVNALRQVGTAESVGVAMHALDKPMDRALDYSLYLTARLLRHVWEPEFAAGRMNFDNNPQRIAFAIQSAGDPALTPRLMLLLAEGRIPASDDLLSAVALSGGPTELSGLLDLAAGANFSPGRRAAVLNLLHTAAAQRRVRPSGDLNRLLPMLNDARAPVAAAAIRLAGMWKLESARGSVETLAGGRSPRPNLRDAAIEALAAMGGEASKAVLASLTEKTQPISTRLAAVAALCRVDVNAAAQQAPAVLADARGPEAAGLFDAFLQSQSGPQVLGAALGGRTIPTAVAEIGIRRATTAGRNTAGLVSALAKAGSVGPMVQQLSPEQMQRVVADVKKLGDPDRGERVFRRATVGCMTCHAIGGSGGQVGPDLLSLGASAPVDYIVGSILEPSAKIKEGYAMTVVTTKAGATFAGLLVRRDGAGMVLRDVSGGESTIPAGDVKSVEVGTVSMMPSGLTASLRRDEFVDLVRFLSELGKEGRFKIGNDRVVRTWRVLMANPSGQDAAAISGSSLLWAPAYSTVSGSLPVGDVPTAGPGERGYVRFTLDVTTGGRVGLRLSHAESLKLFVDGKPAVVGHGLANLDLRAGEHTLTLAVDLSRRKAPVWAGLYDVPGSAARVVLVGGR